MTEVQYLEGLAQTLRASGVSVRSLDARGIGRDPMRVLDRAIALSEADQEGYDATWVVVDVDDHSTLSEALRKARLIGIPMIVSNPCFEIWLLWHYDDCDKHQSRKDLKRALEKFGHNGKRMPVRFPYEDHGRAASRAARHPVTQTAQGPNPSSAMAELVLALQRPS